MGEPLNYWKKKKKLFEEEVKHNKNKKKPGSTFLGFRLPSGIETAISDVEKIKYTAKGGAAEMKKCKSEYNAAMKKWNVARMKYLKTLHDAEVSKDYDTDYKKAVQILKEALKETDHLLHDYPTSGAWALYMERVPKDK